MSCCSVLLTHMYLVSPLSSSLTSPESETSSNSIVLVGYGAHAQLARLEEMRISEFRFLSCAFPGSSIVDFGHPKPDHRAPITMFRATASGH